MKIDHIGVAVALIEPALKLYVDALGGKVASRESVDHMKLSVCKVELGGVVIELLQPQAGEKTISKFLSTRGEGIHHICYAVPDIAAAQARLTAQGYRAVWANPMSGSEGKLVTFLHPKDTNGVLIELRQD